MIPRKCPRKTLMKAQCPGTSSWIFLRYDQIKLSRNRNKKHLFSGRPQNLGATLVTEVVPANTSLPPAQAPTPIKMWKQGPNKMILKYCFIMFFNCVSKILRFILMNKVSYFFVFFLFFLILDPQYQVPLIPSKFVPRIDQNCL